MSRNIDNFKNEYMCDIDKIIDKPKTIEISEKRNRRRHSMLTIDEVNKKSSTFMMHDNLTYALSSIDDMTKIL